VRHTNLHPRFHLPLIPRFPRLRRNRRRQYLDANALAAQDVLQPLRHVALLGVDSVDLAAPSLAKFRLDLLYETPFLRVQDVFIEIRRVRDHEPLSLAAVGIRCVAIQSAEMERPVGIEHQSV